MEGSREFLGVVIMGVVALAVGLTEAALASHSARESATEKAGMLTRALALSMGLDESQVAGFFSKGAGRLL